MQKMSTLHQQPHIPWCPLHRGNSNIARYDLGVKPPHCINQRGFKGHFFGGLVMRMLWEFVSSMWALNPGLRFLRYIYIYIYIYRYINSNLYETEQLSPYVNQWLFNRTCSVPPRQMAGTVFPAVWPTTIICTSSSLRRCSAWETAAEGYIQLPWHEQNTWPIKERVNHRTSAI